MNKITEKEFKQNIDAVLEQATDELFQFEVKNNFILLFTIQNISIINYE